MKKKNGCNTIDDCIKNFNENKGRPFKIILGFYKGEGWTMVKSTLCIILMQLPVWWKFQGSISIPVLPREK